MKVGILSDIHGNYLALDAVLKEAKSYEVERLFILGDLIGYYYHPDRVIELLSDWSIDMIQGNHEGFLARAINDKSFLHELYIKYGSGINKVMEKLDISQLEKLIQLPWRKTVKVDEIVISLSHGAPWDRDFYVYPSSDQDILEKCCVSGADFSFIGHTHYSFTYKNSECTVVNVGSVGQARDHGGIACWGLLDTLGKKVEFKKTQYDITQLVNEVKTIDPHVPYLYQVLLR